MIELLTDNYSKSKYPRQENPINSAIPFIEQMAKEVNLKSKKIQKQFYRELSVICAIATPILSMKKAHAETTMITPMLESGSGLGILPPEIMDILKQLILALGTLSIAVAMLLLMVSGVYRMIGQREKSIRWNTDVLKGFGQVLLAPVIILVLVTIVRLVFGNVRGLEAFF